MAAPRTTKKSAKILNNLRHLRAKYYFCERLRNAKDRSVVALETALLSCTINVLRRLPSYGTRRLNIQYAVQRAAAQSI